MNLNEQTRALNLYLNQQGLQFEALEIQTLRLQASLVRSVPITRVKGRIKGLKGLNAGTFTLEFLGHGVPVKAEDLPKFV